MWNRKICIWLQIAIVAMSSAPSLVAAELELREKPITVKFVDYKFAVKKDAAGVPKMDWELFRSRPRKTTEERWPAIEIENDHIRVQLIPSMARVHSFVNKHTGNEQLWINPCAIPLGPITILDFG